MSTVKILLTTSILFAIGMGAANSEVLLSDNFSNVAWQESNINYGIPGRQAGSQQPITWSKTGVNGGAGVFLADYGSTAGNDNLFLQGLSVGDWNWATAWASPNKDWIGWDDVRFSMDINPVGYGGPTVGHGGFFIGGDSQGWGGGRMQVAINIDGAYNVYDNVLGISVADGSVGSGWHNWTTELKKSGTDYLLNINQGTTNILTNYNVGALTGSYITMYHRYSPTPGDWSNNMSRFDNFTVESVPEPGSFASLVTGILGIGMMLKRRRA